jgi:hypothetical protein
LTAAKKGTMAGSGIFVSMGKGAGHILSILAERGIASNRIVLSRGFVVVLQGTRAVRRRAFVIGAGSGIILRLRVRGEVVWGVYI